MLAKKIVLGGVGLGVVDLCNRVTLFDPYDFVIRTNETVTVARIAQDERYVTIMNEGLQALIITVNGNDPRTVYLGRKETRTIDIRRAMVPGDDNTITFEAIGFGGRGGQAVIFGSPSKPSPSAEDTARR